MSSIDYKQKYLKYKNKYLELKAQQELETRTQTQTGGFVYTPGKYLFFIPQSKADFDSQIPKEFGQKKIVDGNGTIIGSLDSLTNYLGNCTKFLRVGKTSTGYDFANTYNTLYSNQSSSDVIKREVKEIEDKTVEAYNIVKDKTDEAYKTAKPYIDAAVDTTKKVAEQSWNAAKQVGKEIEDQTKKMMEKKPETNNELTDSTIHASDLDVSDTEKPKSAQTGGEGECKREPKKLSPDLLIGDINNVTPDKLASIVKYINDNNLQGTSPENKISKIILVEKPITPGKPSTIDMARNFVVSYEDNKVIVNKK